MKFALWEKYRALSAWFERRGLRLGVVMAYGCVVAVFFGALAQFYIPGKGFSYLIGFSGQKGAARLSKLHAVDFYVERSSAGYDAQYYVQIAMDPSLQNKELRKAVDSLPYRARRILFSAVAHVAGFGQPGAILQAYALLNALSWLLMAALLLHWFPPRHWDNFIRWIGVLFSFGVCVSLRNSLIDGPSLLLIAFGVYLLEKGRPWASTAVLGLSGLGKETNLLAASALLPRFEQGWRAWGRALLRGLLVAAPLALWLVYISQTVGKASDVGYRNFDLPFAAYLHKWKEVAVGVREMSAGDVGALWSLLILVALTVQLLFFVARPQWNQAWWRVGISYALLMVFLGDAVWEGYPGAASRVLLPMQLAFNVLVPVGRGWAAVLLLGNLTLLSAPAALESPSGGGYQIEGRGELLYDTGGEMMTVEFSESWYATERLKTDYWCWAAESGRLFVNNPHDRALVGRLRFSLTVNGRRSVTVAINDLAAWSTTQAENAQVTVVLDNVVLAPGVTPVDFLTDMPGALIGTDPRPLAFRLTNFRVHLHRFAESEAKRPVTP